MAMNGQKNSRKSSRFATETFWSVQQPVPVRQQFWCRES